VLHDLSCVLNKELIYWEGPTLAQKELSSYTAGELELLDRMSALLHDADKNIQVLMQIGSDVRLSNVKDYTRYP
jgi:hypothetical protein